MLFMTLINILMIFTGQCVVSVVRIFYRISTICISNPLFLIWYIYYHMNQSMLVLVCSACLFVRLKIQLPVCLSIHFSILKHFFLWLRPSLRSSFFWAAGTPSVPSAVSSAWWRHHCTCPSVCMSAWPAIFPMKAIDSVLIVTIFSCFKQFEQSFQLKRFKN